MVGLRRSVERPSFVVRPENVVALLGFALFVLLTGLVHARLVVPLDLAVAEAKTAAEGQFFDTWSASAGIVLAAEMSLLYSILASAALWRAGLGVWSLAPLFWLLILPVELALKQVVDQPPLPQEFYRQVYYPFIGVKTQGAFPSGHAIRSAFLCTFSGVLLWSRGTAAARALALAFVPLAGLLGFSRIYLGYHWFSDVIAGLGCGMAMAFLVAPSVAARLRRRRQQMGRNPV